MFHVASDSPLEKKRGFDFNKAHPLLAGEINMALDGIQNVLRRLIDLENRGQRGMEDRRRDTAEKIQQVEGGRRVHQAYRPATSAPAPRYLDRSE